MLPRTRSLSVQAPCLLILLVISLTSIDAVRELRRWESTGILNGTAEHAFACRNDSTEIIHATRRCDGNVDCKDRSDEQGCKECRSPFFLNGTDGLLECFTTQQVKDARWNSYGPRAIQSKLEQIWARWNDGPKVGVNCTADEVRCAGDDYCLGKKFICDGVEDCRLKHLDSDDLYHRFSTDEQGCEETCSNGAKWCAPYYKCTAASKLCDGKQHCPDGSDEQDCTMATCKGALCASGECITSGKVCDGVIDCEDASDEQSCTTSCGAPITNATEMPTIVTCGDVWYGDLTRYLKSEVCTGRAPDSCGTKCSDECDCDVAFRCADGKCISKAKVCNGEWDCPSGEDEQSCVKACAKYPFFSCINNGKVKCMSMAAKCDGVRDCSDGKDEKNCARCPSGAHRCDGGCITGAARCDGVKDCKDGSDERNCSCEECNEGHLDTYHCERSKVCMKRSDACRRGKSRCSNATAKDELFCRVQSKKEHFKEGEDNSRI